MITEDYVSFELALLLKEKGFDEGCHTTYDYRKQFHHDSFYAKMVQVRVGLYLWAPTVQRVMKWLREVHNCHISVYPFNRELPITENTYYTCDVATKKNSSMKGHLRGTWNSYEEACEAAIKYCLENLI